MPSYYLNKGAFKLKDTSVYSATNNKWNDLVNRYHKIENNWYPIYKYTWDISAWGNCTVKCAGGTQTRTVKCRRSDGIIKNNSVCVASGISTTVPVTQQVCNTNECATYPKATNVVVQECNRYTPIYISNGYPMTTNGNITIDNPNNYIGPGWYRVGIAPMYTNHQYHGCWWSVLHCTYILPQDSKKVSNEIVWSNGCSGTATITGVWGITPDGSGTPNKAPASKSMSGSMGYRCDLLDGDGADYYCHNWWYGIAWFNTQAYFSTKPSSIYFNWRIEAEGGGSHDGRMCCSYCYIVPIHMMPD